jgi:NAD(P)-dependent dehydrogenase (short-subunit alcohol dehydrogenase family)
VTGATSGIGRAAAQVLGSLKAELILVGRNEQAGADVVRRLRARSPGTSVEFMRADLSVQSDVRNLAARIAGDYERIDVLINNAGARFDAYRETRDGIELTFATNHLGHFLLTNLLVERLLQAPAARVITVASASHSGASAQGEWFLKKASYDRRLSYAKSKLANILFAYELAERFRHTRVTSNAVDPGSAATNFARNNGLVPWVRRLAAQALNRNLASPRAAAETLVYLATAVEINGVTGKYFRRKREVASSPASHDQEVARRLWDLSVELTDLPRPSAPVTRAPITSP